MLKLLKPYLLCVFTGFSFAGYNIVSKVSLDDGMSRYVLVVYAHAIGALATAILAVLFERNNESKITKPILRNILFLGLLVAVFSRTLYFAGLELTSPTFASAMSNIIPSLTFVLAVLVRMEKLDVSKRSAQAKSAGTLVALGGAILSTLYKGSVVIISPHRRHGDQTAGGGNSNVISDGNWIKGALLLFFSVLSQSIFFILQTWTVKMYPAPLTLTSLICLSGTLLATIMTTILDHERSSWILSSSISLLAPIYCGLVIFGMTTYAQTLVIRERGPVFMTAFLPLSTVVVAILGPLILGEQLYLGEIVGSVLIILCLYVILWAKEYENRGSNLSLDILECDKGCERSMPRIENL